MGQWPPTPQHHAYRVRLRQRGAVAFERVHFAYGPDLPPVIRDLSLSIPAGQTFAIVGPTGHGKSTLVQLLTRFYEADAGSVRRTAWMCATTRSTRIGVIATIDKAGNTVMAGTLPHVVVIGRFLDAAAAKMVKEATKATEPEFLSYPLSAMDDHTRCVPKGRDFDNPRR